MPINALLPRPRHASSTLRVARYQSKQCFVILCADHGHSLTQKYTVNIQQQADIIGLLLYVYIWFDVKCTIISYDRRHYSLSHTPHFTQVHKTKGDPQTATDYKTLHEQDLLNSGLKGMAALGMFEVFGRTGPPTLGGGAFLT